MVHESTFQLLDTVFQSQEDEVRGRVLKILQEFLASEAAKRAEEERGGSLLSGSEASFSWSCAVYKKGKKGDVDMDELIGSSNTFADSGFVGFLHCEAFTHRLTG